jgi:hypothetical protein
VIFGVIEKESLKAMADLSRREAVMLFPLVILVLFFGDLPGAAARCLRRLGGQSGEPGDGRPGGGVLPHRGATPVTMAQS